LGWTFVRVRGTEFFRHPDRALQPVFEMLQRLEIPPEGSGLPTEEGHNRSNELLDALLRRADALRLQWLDNGTMSGDEVSGLEPAPSAGIVPGEPSAEEQRVLEVLKMTGRPLAKSEILARARVAETAWWATIGNLRRRGLVIQEGTRRGATYRLMNIN
jgi:hypothetical protein